MQPQTVVIVASILVAACGSLTPPSLTPAGQKVVFTDLPDQVKSCSPLGEITIADPVAQSNTGTGMKAEERDQAVIELKNGAAEKGGDVVFVDEKKTPSLEKGAVYKCST
jgi:hypothetical protein